MFECNSANKVVLTRISALVGFLHKVVQQKVYSLQQILSPTKLTK